MVFTCQVNCLAASQGGTGGRENSEGRRRKASREDTTRAEAILLSRVAGRNRRVRGRRREA